MLFVKVFVALALMLTFVNGNTNCPTSRVEERLTVIEQRQQVMEALLGSESKHPSEDTNKILT